MIEFSKSRMQTPSRMDESFANATPQLKLCTFSNARISSQIFEFNICSKGYQNSQWNTNLLIHFVQFWKMLKLLKKLNFRNKIGFSLYFNNAIFFFFLQFRHRINFRPKPLVYGWFHWNALLDFFLHFCRRRHLFIHCVKRKFF